METPALVPSINGRKTEIGIIGRRNCSETYVFLHAPRRLLGGYLVYGVCYDITKRKITCFDKFTDEILEDSTNYGQFFKKWRLENRKGFTFRVHDGGYGPRSGHDSEIIEQDWNFNREIKQKEKEDLEKILETLRTSHIDFALRDKTYEKLDLEFEFIGENPEEVVRRNLKKMEGAYFGRGVGGYKGADYSARHPKVKDRATIHHPLKITIEREYEYDAQTKRGYPKEKKATYEFPAGKIFRGAFPFIFPLKNPKEDSACFVIGETCSRFLDARGNEIGIPINFPNCIRRFEGIFKNSLGREIPYSFIWSENEILNYKGEKVAKLNKQGFIIEQ